MLDSVNWIAIAIATVASMAIGAGWYSALAKPWMEACGLSDEQRASVEANDTPIIYVIAAISHVVMAYILSGVIIHAAGDAITIGDGLLTAFLVWLGFVLTTMMVTHRFQFKPYALTAIDSGHYLVVLLAQGAILGWFGV